MKRMVYVYSEGVSSNPPVEARMFTDGAANLFVEINEPLETLVKSDSRLVLKTDHPTLAAPSLGHLTLPSTLQGVHSLPFCPSISHLGRAVSQLPGAEYVTSGQYQSLLQSLTGLVEAYDRFRRVLRQIPVAQLRRADEQVAEKK